MQRIFEYWEAQICVNNDKKEEVSHISYVKAVKLRYRLVEWQKSKVMDLFKVLRFFTTANLDLLKNRM